MPLSRDTILAAVDLPKHEIEIPEWGGTLLVRGLTGKEAVALFREQKAAKDELDEKVMARWVAVAAIDEQGLPLFNSDGDVTALVGKSFAVLMAIFEKLLEINGLTEAAQAELEKNSPAA